MFGKLDVEITQNDILKAIIEWRSFALSVFTCIT